MLDFGYDPAAGPLVLEPVQQVSDIHERIT